MEVNEGTEMVQIIFSRSQNRMKKIYSSHGYSTCLKINVSFPIHKHLLSLSIVFMIPNAIHENCCMCDKEAQLKEEIFAIDKHTEMYEGFKNIFM